MRIFILLSAIVLATSAMAAGRSAPMLRYSESPGFVPPAMARGVLCDIYPDRIELTKNFAGVVVKENRAITVDSTAVFTLLDKAALAKLQTSRGPVDGPTISYSGFEILPTDGIKTIILSSMNGGDGTVISNPAAEAETLRRMMKELCQ
jgi:hypothetical protein